MEPVDAPTPGVDLPAASESAAQAVKQARTRWRTELAELGGRNSLMWHRDLPTGTVDLTVAHPGGVAKLLAGHNTLLSELVREQVALGEARRRVFAIRGKAVELQREHGLSTLFLAIGMASWQLPRAPIPPRAPVLLRGARIRPTDASRQDFVLRLDSDVIFNPALEHYLRGEAGIELDGQALARASGGRSGFDPRPTYDALEELCAGLPQFGIGPQLVLSTYPLAKLPLVAELAAPAPGWAERPLLVSLAKADQPKPTEHPEQPEQESAEQTESVDTDAASGPPPPPSVLAADASQQAVLGLLADGRSAVLDAAPGTGRTQTIVNAVAQTIGAGGAVLVAAEQRRSLDGVHERLRDIGLGDLVLDIRETPAGARRVAADLLDDLDRLHQAGPTGQTAAQATTEPAPAADPLAVLQTHEEHLHGPRAPWGVSLAHTHDVLTRLAKSPHPPTSHVRLPEQVLKTLTPGALGEVRDALTRAVTAGAWKRRLDDPWFGALITTEAEAERAEAIVADLVGGRFSQARDDITRLAEAAGLPAPVNLQQWTRIFDLLGRVRGTLDVFTAQIYEAPLDDLVRGTTKARGGEEKLSAMARSRLRRQARGLLRPGTPPPDLHDRLVEARQERADWESLAGRAARPSTPRGWEDAATEYAGMRADLDWLAQVLAPTAAGAEMETTHLDLLLERLIRLDVRADRLPVTAAVHADLQPLRDRGLGELVDDLARRGVPAEHVESEADLVFWASVHDQITDHDEPADSADLHRAVSEIETQQEALAERARAAVLTAAVARVHTVLAQHPTQEEALRQAVDAGPPLRTYDLIAAAPDLVAALRPCWLASPLTIPAIVPAEVQVDLVILDEAHRLPVARAVPAVARAGQILVVGDSGGLPGLSFGSVVDEELREQHDGEDLLSSAATFLPVRHLDTNYRVLDQRMLPQRPARTPAGYPGVLLPARVQAVETAGRQELVSTVVERVIDHARRSPQHSLAVLVDDPHLVPEVQDALWSRVGAEPDLSGSFREDVAEPFLIASVEQAVGDVRDRCLVVLSGREDLSQAWGRAALEESRRSVLVVTDRPLEELADASAGAALLRDVVRAAAIAPDERDPQAAGSDTQGAASDSALLEDLAARLRAENHTVRLGFGTGPHRIDLVIDDPDEPGRPLLALDTDAAPHDGPLDSTRAWIRARQLRRLGWLPVRVWTTDIFRDPAREVARIGELARAASAERHRQASAARHQ